jgi:hypothetical protein
MGVLQWNSGDLGLPALMNNARNLSMVSFREFFGVRLAKNGLNY